MQHFNEQDIPEGVPPQIVDQWRRQAMRHEDAINQVVDFFDSLTSDQLLTLCVVLGQMTDTESGAASAAHYIGWVNATLRFKHRVCHICGKDHASELLGDDHEKLDPPSPAEDQATKNYVDGQMELPFSEPAGTAIDLDYEYPAGVEPHLTIEQTLLMERFGIDALYTQTGPGELIEHVGFACKNCQMRYVSPQDRSLKEQCDGCIQKVKWG